MAINRQVKPDIKIWTTVNNELVLVESIDWYHDNRLGTARGRANQQVREYAKYGVSVDRVVTVDGEIVYRTGG